MPLRCFLRLARQVITLMYVAVLVPLRTCFDITLEPGEAGWWTELIVDIFFVVGDATAPAAAAELLW